MLLEKRRTEATHDGDRLARVPVRVEDLTVAYAARPALWRVTAEFQAGTLTAVLGPNGAGKSTLIKAALGLVPIVSGRVLFWGGPLARHRANIGYVPQRSAVDWEFPVTAQEVVAMGRYGRLGWFRPVGRREREAARAALAEVGMADLATRQIGQLSGGQQQRVFLARALAQDAQVTVLDEPFAGVDAATEAAIVTVLRRLRDAGRTVVCVHHDLATVTAYFDRALLLNVGVVAEGPAAEIVRPEVLAQAYGKSLAAAGA